jgi:protein phosphatase
VITNVVGGPKAGLHAEVHRMTLEPGDTLVLCTDGLTGMVTDDQIATVVQGSTTPRAASEELVRLANERGGRDNVTVVVARYA